MNKQKLEIFSFLVVFAIVAFLTLIVFQPFLQILTLAAVLAIVFQTPYRWLVRLLGGSRSIAAILFVAIVLVFIIVPLFLLGSQIFFEAQGVYLRLQSSGGVSLIGIQNAIENPIRHFFPSFTFSIGDYVSRVLGFISSNLGVFVSQTFYIVFETFLLLLTFFFFLRDGQKMLAAGILLSPFKKAHTDTLFENMYRTILSVSKSTLLTGLIRWICIAVAFTAFGIPNAMLWGSIGGIVGAIPGLGTIFAIVPAIIYAYIEGNILAAVGLAIAGIAIITLIDNMLGPYFFGKGLGVQPIFVLLSILGGIIVLGPMGLILGPLILSVFLSMLNIYSVLLLEEK